MPAFIVLTKSRGGVVHLNVDHIAAIYTHQEQPEATAVVIAGGVERYVVKETAQEVRDKIQQLAATSNLGPSLR